MSRRKGGSASVSEGPAKPLMIEGGYGEKENGFPIVADNERQRSFDSLVCLHCFSSSLTLKEMTELQTRGTKRKSRKVRGGGAGKE